MRVRLSSIARSKSITIVQPSTKPRGFDKSSVTKKRIFAIAIGAIPASFIYSLSFKTYEVLSFCPSTSWGAPTA